MPDLQFAEDAKNIILNKLKMNILILIVFFILDLAIYAKNNILCLYSIRLGFYFNILNNKDLNYLNLTSALLLSVESLIYNSKIIPVELIFMSLAYLMIKNIKKYFYINRLLIDFYAILFLTLHSITIDCLIEKKSFKYIINFKNIIIYVIILIIINLWGNSGNRLGFNLERKVRTPNE